MHEERIIQRVEGVIGDALKAFKNDIDVRFDAADKRQDLLFSEVYEIKANMATKTELHAVKNELIDHIDGLYKRTDTNDHEITAGRARTERLEGRVSTIENRLGTA